MITKDNEKIKVKVGYITKRFDLISNNKKGRARTKEAFFRGINKTFGLCAMSLLSFMMVKRLELLG